MSGLNRLNRRRFVAGTGLSALGLVLATPTATAVDTALRRTARRAVSVAGTTLESVATPRTPTGYSRLTAGPGWPLSVREDLRAAQAGRDERRVGLSSFAQFTDLHVTDTESPVRFEYLHPYIPSAHRPQETLGVTATAALLARVNSLSGGPFTGRPLDFVMTTGDNTDNHERLELDWFLTLLNGGTVTPNSGDPHRYEGVQDSGSTTYWNPGRGGTDAYSAKGFPRIPGLLAAAGAPFVSPGLHRPWLCTFGNHDDSVVGTGPNGIPGTAALYTGRFKVIGRDEAGARALAAAIGRGSFDPVALFTGGTVREITPDARRHPFDTGEFVRAHLDPARTGPGPVGHGFTAANADGRDVYYTFRIAPGITGISLDTTTQAGGADGSIGLGQYSWLEKTLRRNSSRYYDAFGRSRRQAVDDELFVLFSHHTSGSMDNTLPDARHLLEPRLKGAELVELLGRFPNVLAWVNGHTHRNQITAHVGKTPTRGFWEINTASHIDFPQQARVIEIADNGDGTLSLFTTLIEADAPYAPDYDSSAATDLAGLYREFAYNDIHTDPARTGTAVDRNTELLLAHPLR